MRSHGQNQVNYPFHDTSGEKQHSEHLTQEPYRQGAGVDITEVNRLVKQFEQSKKMMKQMPGLMGGKAGKRSGGFKLPFGL